jgi:hypothetical protein
MIYNLSIQHNGREIIKLDITEVEIKSISGFGIEWIANAYKHYFNLDINRYRLDEWRQTPGSFTIFIRTRDLENLRQKKIDDLGL